MRTLVVSDIFNQGVLSEGDAICIPTNGEFTTDGEMVMGAGFARQMRDMVPGLARMCGNVLRTNGNAVSYINKFTIDNKSIHLFTFPTKNNWRDPSDLLLIDRSAEQLTDLVEAMDCFVGNIFIPAPGCGCGKLDWKDVNSVLENSLTDSKYIITAKSNIFGKKGSLLLTYIGRLHEVDWTFYSDKRLFIVRKVSASAINAVKKYKLQEVPQLSPSAQLFSKYYNWKEGKFTPDEINELKSKNINPNRTDAWWHLYTPRFIEEMKTRPDLIKCMRRTIELLDSGINVVMICYCPDVSKCHRGIIGAVIHSKGYDVIFK